ncbi:hypothetical protein L2750_12735 [Shewanella submarina]|uniref:Uncharacterized protein n=1 Tax=Shewanella submarina TaxID=2016376 RepID=A0ABV7GJJ3_9GAMM|nr:hypothetical protein [Shewanella submarina]MCL1038016.1 hypothetical protein [Shewanella submarina]
MKNSLKYLLVLVCIIFMQACRLTPEPEVKSTNTNEPLLGNSKVVAVFNFTISKDLNLMADFGSELESHVYKVLEANGYTAVKNREILSIIEGVKSNYSGFYDAITGERDDGQYREFKLKVKDSIIEHTNADTLLTINVFKTSAKFDGHKAYWDNTEDTSYQIPNFIFDERKGYLPAISVQVTSTHLDDNKVVERVQGLQTLNKNNGSGFDIHPDDYHLHMNTIGLVLTNGATKQAK